MPERSAFRHLASLLPIALLLVSSCSRQSDKDAGPTPSPTANTAPEDLSGAATSSTQGSGRGDQPGHSTQHGGMRVVSDIPAALRGRWGLVRADCTSQAGDAKGLMTISARQLEFYESVALLQSATSTGPGQITGQFAFTGEGQSWTLQVALKLGAKGAVLHRRDTGRDAMPQPLAYTKCP